MLLKRRRPCAVGVRHSVIALAVSLFVVAHAPAGASPGPINRTKLADQLSPSPSQALAEQITNDQAKVFGRGGNSTTTDGLLAGGPGDAREDGRPAETTRRQLSQLCGSAQQTAAIEALRDRRRALDSQVGCRPQLERQ